MKLRAVKHRIYYNMKLRAGAIAGRVIEPRLGGHIFFNTYHRVENPQIKQMQDMVATASRKDAGLREFQFP